MRHCIKRHQKGSASITAFHPEAEQTWYDSCHRSVERTYSAVSCTAKMRAETHVVSCKSENAFAAEVR